MPSVPKVLLLTGDENEASHYQKILGDYALLTHARDIWEMNRHLEEESCDALFCAWAFYQAFWYSELQEMRQRYPELPVVILSRTGGEREWLEVLEAGAFDLLGLPCQRTTLIPLVEHAVVSNEVRQARKIGCLKGA
jgi:DNA-binding NtrC family response regulator